VLAEIDVLDPEAEPLHQPQPGAMEYAGHEMLLAIELVQDGANLVAREDDGQPPRPPGPAGVDESFQRSLEDDLVEEDQGAIRLALGRGGDVFFDRQMSEEAFDFALAHLQRMPLAMEYDEPLDLLNINILGLDAVMQHPRGLPHAIEPLRPAIGR
jgi:hypothetical protein